MSLLTINAGSSTLKAALFDEGAQRELASTLVDRAPDEAALDEAIASLGTRAPGESRRVEAVGHRVVHGGSGFRAPARIDDSVREGIARAAELAPLHNPPALRMIEAAERRFPGIPHLAHFDTAFFAALPPRAFLYPVPHAWYAEWGIRRFGFHGLSHAYCAWRAAAMLPSSRERSLRLVILHLGNGCSASAVVGGAPVATTMGFTPMEGLMMGTRSGSIDPGILLFLERRRGLDADALDRILNHESGLLGVSGISGDLRELETAAGQGNQRARLAVAMLADRARAAVGALAVTMRGVDGVVFTAGMGENSISLRAEIAAGLECLGLRLDPERNARAVPDADIAEDGSVARILVLRTREDLQVARELRRALDRDRA